MRSRSSATRSPCPTPTTPSAGCSLATSTNTSGRRNGRASSVKQAGPHLSSSSSTQPCVLVSSPEQWQDRVLNDDSCRRVYVSSPPRPRAWSSATFGNDGFRYRGSQKPEARTVRPSGRPVRAGMVTDVDAAEETTLTAAGVPAGEVRQRSTSCLPAAGARSGPRDRRFADRELEV